MPKGNWCCSDACISKRKTRKKAVKKSEVETEDAVNDYKNGYSRAIAWVGLNLLCRRDAVREADGEAMMPY